MLPEKDVLRIRAELDSCANPLLFFHDDPDGSTSYLQCLRYKKEGMGHMIKMTPNVTVKHLDWVKKFGSDKVFIFDVAMVDQEFIDGCPVPVVWLDHHELLDRDGAVYINPKRHGDSTPPCVMVYQACQKDLWLAAVGCVGDWYWSDVLIDFKKKYPLLLPLDLKEIHGRPEEILFGTPLGILVFVLSFNLKGTSDEALRSLREFAKINEPSEILEQTTSAGKYVWTRYLTVKESYDAEKQKALSSYKADDPLFVHTYTTTTYSVTKDLASELCYLHKDKVVVLARERNSEMIMSLRSSRDGPDVSEALLQVLPSFPGSHGGGHKNACGASVKSEDFKEFLTALKDALKL